MGAGASGVAAAKFLAARGAIVGIYDDASVNQSVPEAIFLSAKRQVEFEKFDLCVISPGISINHKIAEKFTQSGSPGGEGKIISELGLGLHGAHAKKVIGITGTNGKTTVTKLISAVLGARGVACGNIGMPVTAVADKLKGKIAVTEISSFMLESPLSFSDDNSRVIDIGVVLNITQDHLERHGSMQEYIRCKAELLKRGKVTILNYDDENCRSLVGENSFFFSTSGSVKGIYLDGQKVVLNTGKRPKIVFDITEFGEEKPHMISNILAVILVCSLLGVRHKRILAVCRGFKSNEHRIQLIGRAGNAVFYDDSKATNIAACIAACKVFKTGINLLLGGQIKGQNFAELFEKLPHTVAHIFCFGSGAEKIMKAANAAEFPNISRFDNMEEATEAAYAHGFGPRVVLLSPACASQDEYTSYAERGEKFIQIAGRIISKSNSQAEISVKPLQEKDQADADV